MKLSAEQEQEAAPGSCRQWRVQNRPTAAAVTQWHDVTCPNPVLYPVALSAGAREGTTER
eukprot:scaffold4493_cov390-Prasinococcus_capsulatus_cf.AAC.7